MLEILKLGGFTQEQAKELVKHLFQSGAFDSGFVWALANYIKELDASYSKILKPGQQVIVAHAAQVCTDKNGKLELDKFLKAIERIPPQFLLAWLQAGHQRYFLDEVVVGLQGPTDYSDKHRGSIIATAKEMGMYDVTPVNESPSEAIAADYGLCIGATAVTVQRYLKSHLRIMNNRPAAEECKYTLFLLLGNRNLYRDGSPFTNDNPIESSAEFDFNDKDKDGQQRDYLSYLAEKYDVAKEELTEAHAVKDRFEAVFKISVEQAKGDDLPRLVTIEATDSLQFMKRVAEMVLPASSGEKPKIMVLTALQPHSLRLVTAMKVALTLEGKEGNVSLVVDCGEAAEIKSSTIMREFAVTVNQSYPLVAKELNKKSAVPIPCVDPSALYKPKIDANVEEILRKQASKASTLAAAC